MKLTTKELKDIFECLVTHLENTGQHTFDIGEDYYWSVPEDSKYHPYEKPDELTLGQLNDDWSELKAIVDSKKEPLGYGMVWLSSILARIGEKSR